MKTKIKLIHPYFYKYFMLSMMKYVIIRNEVDNKMIINRVITQKMFRNSNWLHRFLKIVCFHLQMFAGYQENTTNKKIQWKKYIRQNFVPLRSRILAFRLPKRKKDFFQNGNNRWFLLSFINIVGIAENHNQEKDLVRKMLCYIYHSFYTSFCLLY